MNNTNIRHYYDSNIILCIVLFIFIIMMVCTGVHSWIITTTTKNPITTTTVLSSSLFYAQRCYYNRQFGAGHHQQLQPPLNIMKMSIMNDNDISFNNNEIIKRDDDDDNNNNDSKNNGIRLGFIGCGTIASAIIRGLIRNNNNNNNNNNNTLKIDSISISRRSESKSSKLYNEYPNSNIHIYDNNQDIINESDIIFLTVLPKDVISILNNIQFDINRHILISLISTYNIESLYNTIPSLSMDQIYKMICLPAVQYGKGICILQIPPTVPQKQQQNDDDTNNNINILQNNKRIIPLLCESLGGYVIANNDNEMSAMMIPANLMGTFYGILYNNQQYLIDKHNISSSKASYLVGKMYYSMIHDVIRQLDNYNIDNNENDDNIDSLYQDLINEQTSGGLNEQVLYHLKDKFHIMESYNIVQDAVYQRIIGKTDGSISSS